MFPSLVAAGIFAAILVPYLLFYTAYSKQEKKLDFKLLVVVLTVSKSLDHTLVEMNKAISLAGLTALTVPFLPAITAVTGREAMRDLTFISMSVLWVHSCYSSFKYYGSNNIPSITLWGPKTVMQEITSPDSKSRLMAVSCRARCSPPLPPQSLTPLPTFCLFFCRFALLQLTNQR